MELNTLLLFIITCVITIYFIWNYFNNKKRPASKHENDIRYYELKSKYEFLVAIVSLITAVVIFYGLGTKKDIENNVKSEFNTRFESMNRKVSVTESKINKFEHNLTNDQQVMNAYYGALELIESKEKLIDKNGQRAQGKFREFENKIDTLNKKNLLHRNFYHVDNIKVDYNKIEAAGLTSIKFKFDTLITTFGDRLPRFRKPPIIVGVSDIGFGLHVHNVTSETFQVFIDPEWFSAPKSGMIGIRLIITPGE